MSLHNHKRPAFTVVSAGMLLIPSVLLGVFTITKPINVHAASLQCNVFAKTISEAVCMQDMNNAVKESMVLERQYELKDARDGKKYYIAKLVDGNVWMTQNLDFDIDSDRTYTPDDTDIPSVWKPAESTLNMEEFLELMSETIKEAKSATTDLYGFQHSVDPGDLYWDGTFATSETPIVYNQEPDTVTDASSYTIPHTSDSGDRHYHLGNYYNWLAATAVDGREAYTDDRGEADQSVCPAGWTLPKLSGEYRGEVASSYIPSFIEVAEEYYSYESGEWTIDPVGSPVFFNLSGVNVSDIGSYGALWTREYFTETMDASGEGDDSTDVTEFIRLPLKGTAGFYDSDDAYYRGLYADEDFVPIRCVARSRAAIEANWIQGDEHEVESEEEGILKIEAPEEDGEIVVIMIDDEPVSENSGISIDYDDEEGGFVITFPSEYLDTLEEGEHVVQATFTSGRSAYARLTVSSTAVPHTGAPDTGKFTNDGENSTEEKTPMAIIASFAICVTVMVGMMPIIRSKIRKLF